MQTQLSDCSILVESISCIRTANTCIVQAVLQFKDSLLPCCQADEGACTVLATQHPQDCCPGVRKTRDQVWISTVLLHAVFHMLVAEC